MPLVRIALGTERALSNSRTGCNLHLTDEELKVLRDVDERMFKLTSSGIHEELNPRIHTQVIS